MKKNSILLAVCCGVLALAAGCAAPGAPLPPSLRLPQAVDNLSAVRKGSRVLLTWSPPTETTDRQPMRWPSTTRICRVVNRYPISECGQSVAQINSSDLASAAPAAPRPVVSFEDVLPEALIAPLGAHSQGVDWQSQATYAVEVVNQRGRSAGLSNQVRIPLVATEPPPASFRAALDAQGPLLQWNMASTFEASNFAAPGSTAAPELSCRMRIYRRSLDKSQGKVGFVPVGEQPCQPGAGEARDSSFEWEKEYDYKVAVVTVIAAPGRPAVEVEGDDSNLAHLVAHDIFPPAVPSGLQAVYSSVGQKPFIDLTWAPDTESDLAGYIVYRRTSASGFAVVTPAPVKAPAWRDNDVRPGENYFYTVTAIDVRGNESGQSAPASERVPRELVPQEVR